MKLIVRGTDRTRVAEGAGNTRERSARRGARPTPGLPPAGSRPETALVAILIFHEDLSTGSGAKRGFELQCRQLAGARRFMVELWTFSTLGDAPARASNWVRQGGAAGESERGASAHQDHAEFLEPFSRWSFEYGAGTNMGARGRTRVRSTRL